MEPLERDRLATILRHLRVSKGLRQSDLALASRVSRSAISALERGRLLNPSAQLLTAIASGLGVQHGDLIALSDSEVSILELLRVDPLSDSGTASRLQKAHRALILSRRFQLAEVEQAAVAALVRAYGNAGDGFQAALYSTWRVGPPDWSRPAHQAAVLDVGQHLHRVGEWTAEISLYRHFLLGLPRTNSQCGPLLLQLGYAYSDVNSHPQAVRSLRRAHHDAAALGQTETSALALLGLSYVLSAGGRHTEALLTFRRAVELASTHSSESMRAAVAQGQVVMSLLASRSLDAARDHWHDGANGLVDGAASFVPRMHLLRSWIVYSLKNGAWHEALAAVEEGLALVKSTGSNRGMKGQLLWARSQANLHVGEAWERDLEWAADLLETDLRRVPTFAAAFPQPRLESG
jgi:transcriptional regulator with XRE-family HTH domain